MARISFSKVDIASKSDYLDNTRQNDVKEKSYFTKQVDSSIAILESGEDDIVLEALLYLSKYVDVQFYDLFETQQCLLLQKLLNLLKRNICILRLTLRLLGVLLRTEMVLMEFDQDMYDNKILKIADMYVTHTDIYVKQFCANILSKLSDTCRINCLIFMTDLINPILRIIEKPTDTILLELTLELFLKLLNSPATIGILPDTFTFDVSILLMHLESTEKKIAELSFNVIVKLTSHCLNVFQQMFKEVNLVENMLDYVINPEKYEFHQTALEIITNCVKSEETSSYFLLSTEFSKFCQWVKTCDQEYLFPCVNIFLYLTRYPFERQTLFDISAEQSILYFLRSTEKNVLNKTCQAISNMTTHKYCCERMLTPVVMRELSSMLLRKDEEDPGNEIALKTICDFSRRHANTLNMLYVSGVHKILLTYISKKGNTNISEESFLRALEILYKMSLHPLYQKEIADINFFQTLLYLFQTTSTECATFICEVLTNFVGCADFRGIFLSMNGPQIFVGALQTSNNHSLLKHVFVFIHSNLIYDNVVKSFLQNNLVRVLKGFPEPFRSAVPIVNQILKLVYGIHPPLKLFETKKLEVIDKLGNMFYLINGTWRAPFPFVEILEASMVSPICTVYFVDYSFEIVKFSDDGSITSETISLIEKTSSERNLSMQSIQSNMLNAVRRTPFDINYGKLSPDLFLPRYIYHISKIIDDANTMDKKVRVLAEYVDTLLCGSIEADLKTKIQMFKEHIKSLKRKLGTSMIPIGYLRLGFHCERSLLFKAIGDKCGVPTSLVKGTGKMYWNEVGLLNFNSRDGLLKFYVVDLMDNIGNLLRVGSKPANLYCTLKI